MPFSLGFHHTPRNETVAQLRKYLSVSLIRMPELVQSGSDSSSKQSKLSRISPLPEYEETARR